MLRDGLRVLMIKMVWGVSIKEIPLYFQCDGSKVGPQYNVLKAIHTAAAAWDNVGSICIANCFSNAGFSLSLNPNNDFNAVDYMPLSSFVPLSASLAQDSDDNILLTDLTQRLTSAGITFTDFVKADTDLIVTEEMADNDIVTELLQKKNHHTESSSDSEPDEKPPTLRDIASTVEIIRRGRKRISAKTIFSTEWNRTWSHEKTNNNWKLFFLRNELCITLNISVG